MKTTKITIKSRIFSRSSRLYWAPTVGHLLELTAAIVIFASGQNIWAAVAKAASVNTPSVPTGLMVSSRAAPEIDLSWSASSGPIGVAGYNIYRNGVKVGASLDTTYADTGLTPNTAYTYTVTAYDSASDESVQSVSVNTSTLVDTSPPSIPSNLHQTGATVSTLTIAWDPSADNVGVTAYNIYRNGSLVKVQSGTSFTDTGLATYTGYNYIIISLDAAANQSSPSVTFVANTAKDLSPPTVPDTISETASTVNTLSLLWAASTDNVGVTGYYVYRNGILVSTQGGTTFNDSGLTYSSSYTYTISAYDASGNVSAQSQPFNATSSNDTTPPTAPANLSSNNPLDNRLSLSWDASTDNVQVAGYKVYRNNQLVGTTISTNFTDLGLAPSTSYNYFIKAYDQSNNISTASSTISASTVADSTPPSTPTNFSSTTQTDTTLSFSWTAGTDNIAVGGYNIYRNNLMLTSTTGTSFTDSGLNINTSYSYKIQTYDTSGNLSPMSTPVTTSTIPDLVPPSIPANLSSTAQTNNSIDLMWDSASDDVGVASYILYRNGTLIANLSGTTYTDTGRYFSTSYSYSVAAVDTSGNVSQRSSPLLVSTLADLVPPTVNITSISGGQTLSQAFPISASASDLFSLSHVQFFVDTSLVNSINSAPYSFNWNSYAVHNGAHTLTAVATNAAGLTTSQLVSFNINNPPPPIVADLNGDHRVNILDLSILLSTWGRGGAADLQHTGRVNIFDLSILLSHYGEDNSNYH
jgi:chitodextrinase